MGTSKQEGLVGLTVQSTIMAIVQTKVSSIIAHARVSLKTWPHDAPRILRHCQPNDNTLEALPPTYNLWPVLFRFYVQLLVSTVYINTQTHTLSLYELNLAINWILEALRQIMVPHKNKKIMLPVNSNALINEIFLFLRDPRWIVTRENIFSIMRLLVSNGVALSCTSNGLSNYLYYQAKSKCVSFSKRLQLGFLFSTQFRSGEVSF